MKNPTDLLLERLEHSVIAGKMSRRTFLVRALAAGLLGAMPLRLLADELETIRKAQADKLAQLEKSYDYIVIGSGSAGCALVGNLAEKTDGNILLIEAGIGIQRRQWIIQAHGLPIWAQSAIGGMWRLPARGSTTVLSLSILGE